MKKYLSILAILIFFSHPTSASATAYYIDFVNGSDANAGTATTTAWQSLDKFAENARSAGDIAFVRRGMASTTNVSDVTISSSGSVGNPIIIEADYDNLWSDFATSSNTYTVAVGSTTITANSATDITANQWVYIEGDCAEKYNASSYNDCEFAYQVANISGNSVNLYLPYKGHNPGTGKNVRILPYAPQWNLVSGNFRFNFSSKNDWIIKGLHLRGTSASGQITDTSSLNLMLYDDILQGNGASDIGISTATQSNFIIRKTRIFDDSTASISFSSTFISYPSLIKDCIFSNALSSITVGGKVYLSIEETYLAGNLIAAQAVSGQSTHLLRNVYVASYAGISSCNDCFSTIAVEDEKNVIGANSFYDQRSGSNSIPIASSTSATSYTRAGGGPSSEQILPLTTLGANNYFTRLKLFEYPIYTDTSSKTYTMYFMSTSTSEWSQNPTSQELFIECEYWNFSNRATSSRAVTKSTETVNFAGSTAWQTLSVTCKPTNAGILYLRGWYGKPKETSLENGFYIDTTPIMN